MTIRDSDVSEMLERLATNTELPLKLEENESAFSLLLLDGSQLLTTNRVIKAKQRHDDPMLREMEERDKMRKSTVLDNC